MATSPIPDPGTLSRIQAYVRHYAIEQRQAERSGPFLATFGRHSSGPYLNYAVPDDHCEPSGPDVAALVDLYSRRGLHPRVELAPRVAPAVRAALLEGGFVSDGTYLLMACRAESLLDVRSPNGVGIVPVESHSQWRSVLEVRQAAFGESGSVTEQDVERARSSLESGGFAALAVDSSTGEAIGSGACLAPYEGITELIALGVRGKWLRQGVGALVASALTQTALLAGVQMVYLTAAHDEGERLYERVGYLVAGESLHLSHSPDVARSSTPS